RLAVRSRGGAARDEPAAALERPDRVLPGGGAHVLEDDVDAALVGGVEDRLRPLGIRRVVDAERRQDKGRVNGTSVLDPTRRPLPALRYSADNQCVTGVSPRTERWSRGMSPPPGNGGAGKGREGAEGGCRSITLGMAPGGPVRCAHQS